MFNCFPDADAWAQAQVGPGLATPLPAVASCARSVYTTSEMIHHLGVSMNKQHTAGLLICHGISRIYHCLKPNCISSNVLTRDSQVSYMPAISPARGVIVAIHAWTNKLHTKIMS